MCPPSSSILQLQPAPPPPTPTIVYATQYKHMLELVICNDYALGIEESADMSPLLLYSPISTCSCLLPLLSSVISSACVFTWVNDRGGGICLPFHCDCGLKCFAQDCQMTHFLVKFSQMIYFVVLIFTAPEGDK